MLPLLPVEEHSDFSRSTRRRIFRADLFRTGDKPSGHALRHSITVSSKHHRQ